MFSFRQAFNSAWIAVLVAFSFGDGLLVLAVCANDDDRDVLATIQTNVNLLQISTAMFDYHDKYKHLPPAYVLGADGKPAHSWRVLVLEFLDQEELLKQYNFNEPWNGPNNRKLADKMPGQYRVAADPKSRGHLTSYVVLVGAKTAFPGAKSVKLEDITDGRDKTILAAEAEGFNVHWMEPRDWDVDVFPIKLSEVKKPGFSSHNPLGPYIALADGVRMRLDFSASAEQLRRMSTIAGAEDVNLNLVSRSAIQGNNKGRKGKKMGRE